MKSKISTSARAILALVFLLSAGAIALAEPPGGAQTATASDPETSGSIAVAHSNQGAFAFPKAGDAPLMDAPGYQKMIQTHGADLLVVNYWATFCGPCVEELPEFVKLYSKTQEKLGPPNFRSQIMVVGVSLDLTSTIKSRVLPFLAKNSIPYPNFVLDVDQDAFIQSVSSAWHGDIPATVVYDSKGNKLAERLGPFESGELLPWIADIEYKNRIKSTQTDAERRAAEDLAKRAAQAKPLATP